MGLSDRVLSAANATVPSLWFASAVTAWQLHTPRKEGNTLPVQPGRSLAGGGAQTVWALQPTSRTADKSKYTANKAECCNTQAVLYSISLPDRGTRKSSSSTTMILLYCSMHLVLQQKLDACIAGNAPKTILAGLLRNRIDT